MGVLESGIPYLSGRGLARLCGIDHKTLHELSSDWSAQKTKPRGKVIDQLLRNTGYTIDSLYVKAEYAGQEVNAYTEPVCMAFLEYYAFEAAEKKEQAVRAFRNLARLGLREFVYKATGYKIEQKALDSWKHFHDRTDLTMDAAPDGYFGLFREIAIMIVPMIRNGVFISDKVVPDISVGIAWSDYWQKNGLTEKFGERTRYNHAYPDYYPQARSNPQSAFAYPNDALGAFRSWLTKYYIANKFPTYLLNKAKDGTLKQEVANKALGAFGVKQIEHQPKKLK